MSEERRHKKVSGLLFVATMFICGGIGMLLGRPDVGWVLGMGIGFVVMAIARYYGIDFVPEKRISIRVSKFLGASILVGIGLILIVAGLAILYRELLGIAKGIGGLIIVAIGLVFIALAMDILRPEEPRYRLSL